MIIHKYDITLHRLKKEDIEFIREKRNSESVRSKMIFQQHISAEMQEKWFQSINNATNHYFVIIHKGEKVGLVHGKNVNFDLKQCETGILLWDEKNWFSGVAIQAVICALDYAFLFLNFDQVFSTVRKDNRLALRYNLKLGFEIISEEEHYQMKLSKENYFSHREKINTYLNHKTGDKTFLNTSNFEFDENDFKASWFLDLPEEIKHNFRINQK